jgi:type II secretory ATPase GspE/PulE/Tfp pilus assembly ATPase PilB-like protein
MIRTRPFIYFAIALAALLAIQKHAGRFEGVIPITALSWLPSPRLLLFCVAVSLLFAFLPFSDVFPSKRQRVRSRKQFTKESFPAMAARITEMAEESRPDIPLLVDYVIFQAIEAGASDIHLDPSRQGFTVKLRIDGMMTHVAEVPGKLKRAIANRLKVLSNLVVYQGYLPQDGRLGPQENGSGESGAAEFRIAFMPTLHGERIVIRILGRSADIMGFDALGMTDRQHTMMRRFVAEPQGMIILTGPTGSGKTTTIYAALRTIRDESNAVRAIATLEDPIEKEIPGINQSQVNEQKAFTFEKGLRALLRQDPDVIMVGEIRDKETARIAIQAGMTGHLIITTVHANSSAATFSRLMDMGIQAHAINTAVTAVIAQRLVRRLCITCKRDRLMTEDEITTLGLAKDEAFTVFEGAGCADCGGAGFKGRVALFEILEVNEAIRNLVAKEASADAIYTEARAQGMTTLFEQGIDALQRGETSPDEMRRVVAEMR